MPTIQKNYEIPEEVALCPECASRLTLEITEWESETGIPTECGCDVSCDEQDKCIAEAEVTGDFDFESHRYWQSDWQPVIDKVVQWAQKNVKIAEGICN